MKSQDFQFASYTPAEFEQFRSAVQQDGFTVTQNTIDTVSGHIGSLTYITGKYNRNQQLLVVTIKTSPWQSLQDVDLESNVLRVVNKTAAEETPVNSTPVKTDSDATTPIIAAGPVKNAVVPSAATPVVPKQVPVPATTSEAPKVDEAPKVETGAEAATTTPTKS